RFAQRDSRLQPCVPRNGARGEGRMKSSLVRSPDEADASTTTPVQQRIALAVRIRCEKVAVGVRIPRTSTAFPLETGSLLRLPLDLLHLQFVPRPSESALWTQSCCTWNRSTVFGVLPAISGPHFDHPAENYI